MNTLSLITSSTDYKGEVKGVLEVFNRSRLSPNREWVNFLETLATNGDCCRELDFVPGFAALQF